MLLPFYITIGVISLRADVIALFDCGRCYCQVADGIAHTLAHMFNSISGQCCEAWASQFPFLHSLRDVIPSTEACLYGCINWSLTQAQQQSSMGLSQSFPSKRGGKARLWAGFHFSVQKRPVPGSSGQSMAKMPLLETGNEACASGNKSAGGSVSTSSANTRRKGGHGGWSS